MSEGWATNPLPTNRHNARKGPNQPPDVAIGLQRPGTNHFFTILVCTDLRIGVSEAKFSDVEADFNVKKSPPPHENPKKNREIFSEKKKFGVKKSKVANRPKRTFPKFRIDRNKVRGANLKQLHLTYGHFHFGLKVEDSSDLD